MTEWDKLYPQHPSDQHQFAGAYADYPGGWGSYWRDFKAAAMVYYREGFDADERAAHGLSFPEYADQQARYALKRRVYDVANVVAEQAGVDDLRTSEVKRLGR